MASKSEDVLRNGFDSAEGLEAVEMLDESSSKDDEVKGQQHPTTHLKKTRKDTVYITVDVMFLMLVACACSGTYIGPYLAGWIGFIALMNRGRVPLFERERSETAVKETASD